MHRIYLAFLCFFRILFGGPLPPELLLAPPRGLEGEPPRQLPPRVEAPRPAEAARPVEAARPAEAGRPARAAAPRRPDPGPGALQLLGLLQREGRLVDFLSEDIDGYDDASIGAAVRDIHKGCKKVLSEAFGVEPVLQADEDEAVTVDTGFDPARIRLVGNVTGSGPFKGTLRHHGWRAARVSLPALNDGLDATIVAPAEVELS
jgi:hypothetical protein